jgi:hypothetical protein
MADRVIFKGTKKLQRYVAELSKGMKNGLEDACKELSMKAVEKAQRKLMEKDMFMSGQLYESIKPIPGPYVNKKNGTAKIGFQSATPYAAVQEFGRNSWSNFPNVDRLKEWAWQKKGLVGSKADRFVYNLGKKMQKEGLKGKKFGIEALENLVPEVNGKIFSSMKDANGEAIRKANKYNQ